MSQLYQKPEPQTDDFNESTTSTETSTTKFPFDKKLFGISTAALLLGGATWTLLAQSDKDPDTGNGKASTEAPTLPIPVPVEISVVGGKLLPHDVNVAHEVNSELSFSQAFGEARDEVGPGGLFIWQGNIYNTFTKEEWQDLSLPQRQEFLADVGYQPTTNSASTPTHSNNLQINTPEPITIEGYLNGQRVIGLDYDHDGVIDTLVMDGADGYTYRVVDATGNDGLDTLYKFDSLNHEIVLSATLDEPFLLTNTTLEQGLEQAMATEIMTSVLEDDTLTPILPVAEHDVDNDDLVPYHESEDYDIDDSYINNADVSDMDES